MSEPRQQPITFHADVGRPENLVRVDARGAHVTLAGLLDAKRSEVADLERRIHACPHDWSVASTSVETLYAKGFGPNGERLPPIHVRVTTSVCGRCGSAKVEKEDVNG